MFVAYKKAKRCTDRDPRKELRGKKGERRLVINKGWRAKNNGCKGRVGRELC